jgi:drug/metabolite transporter superfamily protein YnfA
VGVGFGCLGFLVFGFVYLIWYMLIATAIVFALGLVLAAYGIVFLAVFIDWALMRAVPRYAARRVDRGPLRWPQNVTGVINSTISVGGGRCRLRRS